MRDGMIVQSGKYHELLDSGMDFKALVAAHETSMELVDVHTTAQVGNSLTKQQRPQDNGEEANSENKALDQVKSDKGSSKLIKDEERETGRVSLRVYKLYCTEAFGWWGVVGVVLLSLLWQSSIMAGDYWLAYETAEEHASLFNPSLFIRIYAIIAGISFLLVLLRAFSVTILGLKTAQIFFSQILHSILHAPMSFFDTTPSGRILTRVRKDRLTLIGCACLLIVHNGLCEECLSDGCHFLLCRHRLIRQTLTSSFPFSWEWPLPCISRFSVSSSSRANMLGRPSS